MMVYKVILATLVTLVLNYFIRIKEGFSTQKENTQKEFVFLKTSLKEKC